MALAIKSGGLSIVMAGLSRPSRLGRHGFAFLSEATGTSPVATSRNALRPSGRQRPPRFDLAHGDNEAKRGRFATIVALMYAGGHYLEDYGRRKMRREMTALLSQMPRPAERQRDGRCCRRRAGDDERVPDAVQRGAMHR
jgi:hypothetical protein